MSSGFALHPEAFADLDEMRNYIAQQNPDAADRVITEIFDAVHGLVRFPNQVTGVRISVRGLCGSFWYVNT
jgi:plasmid stabilization system protein ParE